MTPAARRLAASVPFKPPEIVSDISQEDATSHTSTIINRDTPAFLVGPCCLPPSAAP